MWQLFMYDQSTIDMEPEFIMETNTIQEAVNRVNMDFQNNIEGEYIIKDIPQNVPYHQAYKYDERGAFFQIPDDIKKYNRIHIAAIYFPGHGSCEFFVVRKPHFISSLAPYLFCCKKKLL